MMLFCGPSEMRGLKDQIRRSRRPEALRGLYGDWLASLTATRDGKRLAEELQGKLLAVL